MSSTTGSTSMPWSTCSAPSPKSGGSALVAARAASRARATESVPITISRSAPRSSAGLIGVLRRVPPSKYQPRASSGCSTRTGGNRIGIAADARTCWSSRRVGDVVDRVRAVLDPLGVALDEHDGAAGARGGGDGRRRLDDVVVARCGGPRPSRSSGRGCARTASGRAGSAAASPGTREDLARVAQRRQRGLAQQDRPDRPCPCCTSRQRRRPPSPASSAGRCSLAGHVGGVHRADAGADIDSGPLAARGRAPGRAPTSRRPRTRRARPRRRAPARCAALLGLTPFVLEFAMRLAVFGRLPTDPLPGICSANRFLDDRGRSMAAKTKAAKTTARKAGQGGRGRPHEPLRAAVHRGPGAARQRARRGRPRPPGLQAHVERQGAGEGADGGPQAPQGAAQDRRLAAGGRRPAARQAARSTAGASC